MGRIPDCDTRRGIVVTVDAAPPFVYYGGKTRVASRVADLLPEHDHYVEPFAGGLSVLLVKSRARMETVNDIDEQLVTFWRVLRDRPDDLMTAMALTPHSVVEVRSARDAFAEPLSELEVARRVWVRLSQARAGRPATGFRQFVDPAGSRLSMPGYLSSYIGRVPACAERLAGVTLECRPALDVIVDYGRHPGCLLYCDPPYLATVRNSTGYAHEMGGVQDHYDLACVLRECRAAVVVSGYDSAEYEDWYSGWYTHRIQAWTGTSQPRVEVLWSNRPLGGHTLWGES